MGESFIGSHISLVTKSDLRYEGTLTDISLEESTITLKNVRAFGDEGRRPLAPQPPQDKVYELILFKADDIADLTVISNNPAPFASAASQLQDPAILSATAQQPGYGYGYQAPPPPAPRPNPWGPPPGQTGYTPLYGDSAWSVSQPAPPPPQHQQQQQQHYQSTAPAPPQRPAAAPAPPAAGAAPAVAPTVSVAPKQLPAKQEAAPKPPPSTWAQAAGGGRGAGGGGRGAAPAAARPAPAPPAAGQNAGGGRGAGHANARAGVPAGPPGQPRPTPGATAAGLPVPKEDYDFEAANTKFNKEELAKEVKVEVAETVYKKDDFFDLLSCEALAGAKAAAFNPASNDWRLKMSEQKRIDMETFGGLGGVRHNTFGRGRGGGRGGGTGIPQANNAGGGRGGPPPHGGRGFAGGAGRGGRDGFQGGRGGGFGGGRGRGRGGRGDQR